MPSRKKIRLTELLVARGFAVSLADAERIILAGEVLGDVSGVDTRLTQPGLLVEPSCTIRLKTRGGYVSRGGDKLAGALCDFSIDPQGLRCLDVGASTGGFTDCLLQHGAAAVVAVDVAYGQFAWSLRNDARVTVVERANIRDVSPAVIGAPFEMVVADVSFTSIRTLLSLFASLLVDRGTLVSLVKPQFELASAEVGKGGVVVSLDAHIRVLERVVDAAIASDLAPQGLSFSTLKGPRGNIEFILLAQQGGIPVTIDIPDIVACAHARLD
jgi:23S rRNA (cytidine1920-2'-O)/16S rRNA (cytidine1409-2'-O)-methyltransferase